MRKLFTLVLFFSFQYLFAQTTQVLEWNINGVARKALVYIPVTAKSVNTPVVFAFHGHGGTMQNIYRTRGFDKLWGEAIFICPQGLNTPGKLVDPEGKQSGWTMGDITSNNRDLQFFDAMLKTLRADYKIDNSRIYATGHSNGGGFAYLLWAARGNEFAAFAPTATTALRLMQKFMPKPVLHLMGEKDPLVKPHLQRATCNGLLKLNECEKEGTELEDNATLYKGKNGNDVLLYIHNGGHEYPKSANTVIIDFFRRNVKN